MKQMRQIPALLLLFALVALPGCGTLAPSGPYAGNKVVYQADLTLATAYDIVDGFLVWELAHRGKPECPASVTAAADQVRLKAPAAFAAALNARDVYAQASNSANQSALMTALTTLQGFVAIANQYIIPTISKP